MKNLLTAALFLMVARGACFGQSEPQSLGDLARRNKQDKKPAVVFTDDDIRSSRGVISVVGDESDRPAASVSSQTTDSSPKKASEASRAGATKDSSQVADLKKKLDSYKQEQAGWKNSAKKYEDQLATETDDFRRTTYQEALDNDKKNATAIQQKIDQTNSELSKAQEQAAAAGSKSGPASTPPAGPQP